MKRIFEGLQGCILAAGSSRRMGARNKLLMPIEGRPLVCRLVQSYLEAGATDLVVVLGHEAPLVRAALDEFPLEFVEHEAHSLGMGGSIAAAMEAIAKKPLKGFFVSPADLPHLRPSSIQDVANVFAAVRMARVVRPCHGGIPGHPVFFPVSWIPRLRRLRGDVGARLSLRESDVVTVPQDHPGVVRDIDGPSEA